MSFQMTGVTDILVGGSDPKTLHPDVGKIVLLSSFTLERFANLSIIILLVCCKKIVLLIAGLESSQIVNVKFMSLRNLVPNKRNICSSLKM